MRSSELFGFVPGARIPIQVPPDGVFRGWNYPWARDSTLIEYFENTEMLQAAISGEYTQEALGIPESLFSEAGWLVGDNFVWDGGTPNQFFSGYFSGEVPGGWASWENVEIADDSLYSPETRVDIPGVYTPYHYSLRRFTSYLDVDFSCYDVNSAFLVSAFPSGVADEFVFPLNDSIFVFVNGQLAYWASTDVIGGGNIAQNRLYFYGVRGMTLTKEYPDDNPPPDARFLFTGGWYLTLGGSQQIANIAPFLRNGKNVIDVIADDYYFGGGMSRINVLFDTTPRISL
ncbi:MAG: hypothetical protein LBL09_02090 [Oscillospiraceae bacterium]|jgi:hypothetical protein|nr:hypothetical protein [Oscillospiraceae bacterium]